MRFFTTLQKAGRLEFFAVAVVAGAFLYAITTYVLELKIAPATEGQAPQDMLENISINSQSLDIYLVGLTVYLLVVGVNACRRLKDLGKSYWMALTLLMPATGFLFQLWLSLATSTAEKSYTPYGDNPYDPNSWVAPEEPSVSGSSVSYNGQDLFLPGELTQEHGEQAA